MGMAMAGMPVDSFVAERDSMIKVVLEDLGERKSAPAESVFHNLKVMSGLPAERLLGSMNGMSRSLGVSCRYCHIPGHWKDDDKKMKGIAREMMKMSSAINEDYLSKMDFGDDKPHVGCMTCHRGETEPMRAMRRGMARPGGPGGPPPGGTPPGDKH
jgi:photosynthetic reaction center cytochrome c subunit